MDCQFLFHWPTKLFTYYEDFFQSHKNETFDEIKTSLENLWQRMIQLSELFQYSFLLILKRKCLVGASRCESAVGRVVDILLQLLSIHDGAVGVTNLGVMLLYGTEYYRRREKLLRVIGHTCADVHRDVFCISTNFHNPFQQVPNWRRYWLYRGSL